MTDTNASGSPEPDGYRPRTAQPGQPEYGAASNGGHPTSSQGGYAGPPPTGYGPPPTGYGSPHGGYAQPPQPVDPYSGGQSPGWGYPPPYPMAYVAPIYAGAYAPVPPGERRPGTLTAAAVLGYVNAGFLIIMGVVLFSTSSFIDGLDSYDYYNHDSLTAEFAIDGVLNLIAGGLLIGGAVAMTNRASLGRLLYSVGGSIVIAESIYWTTRWGTKNGGAYINVYSLLYAAVAIIGLSLAWVGGASKWFAGALPRTA